jgi:hypothetical protein
LPLVGKLFAKVKRKTEVPDSFLNLSRVNCLEDFKKKEEGRRKKEEGRSKKEEGSKKEERKKEVRKK